jgi:hypothetical protein
MNVRSGIAVLLVSGSAASNAAELKSDTVKAWDEYIRAGAVGADAEEILGLTFHESLHLSPYREPSQR